jgi:hypothetical protein
MLGSVLPGAAVNPRAVELGEIGASGSGCADGRVGSVNACGGSS